MLRFKNPPPRKLSSTPSIRISAPERGSIRPRHLFTHVTTEAFSPCNNTQSSRNRGLSLRNITNTHFYGRQHSPANVQSLRQLPTPQIKFRMNSGFETTTRDFLRARTATSSPMLAADGGLRPTLAEANIRRTNKLPGQTTKDTCKRKPFTPQSPVRKQICAPKASPASTAAISPASSRNGW